MQTAHHPGVRVLADAGWLAPVETAGLQVEDLSRSHVVTRVTPPGRPGVVVKMPSAANLAAGRSLAGELLVYRLATWMEGIAAAVPQPLLIDEARQVLVLRGEDLGPSLATAAVPEPALWAWCGERLGTAMGRWHRDTEGLRVGGGARPFALDLVERTPVALGTLGPAARQVAEALLADVAVGAALRGVAAEWTPACLVHGDLKWDNCLLEGPPGAPHGVRVIDWELAAFGDPAWDAGCAVGELHVAGALHGAAPPGAIGAAVGATLQAYATAWRPPDAATLCRIGRAAAARAGQAAIEHAEAGPAEPVQRLVAAAQRLAADPEALA